MKKIIFGILASIGLLITFSACKGKASELEREPWKYEILQKWDLPEALNEISGIAWIDEGRIACVQDEDGIIFIYNLKTQAVEDEIEFGSGGDYEGIAVIGKDIYVLRSDGIIIEISNFAGTNQQVKKHATGISKISGINLEGLCADPKNNRLLVAVKERKRAPGHKEIYSLDLNRKFSEQEIAFKIDFSDPIFQNVNGKKKFMPGEIGLHPETGEFYILDGTEPKLLIAGQNGNLKELFWLKLEEFGNPEGLSFSPEGDLYISNEAENGPANILKVTLNRE